jgi:hypothetical protein
MSPWTQTLPDRPRPADLRWLWLIPAMALWLAWALVHITHVHDARRAELAAAESAR